MTDWNTYTWFKRVAALLVLTMSLLAAVPDVHAGFVPSPAPQMQGVERDADMSVISRTLENRIVAERLAALGYDPVEIQDRLALLTDEEARQVAAQMEDITAGGSALGVIIALLLIVLLVILILKLTDKRIVID